jgi:cytochrome P450
MTPTVPSVSLRDNLFYNLAHVVPYYTQGIFTRSKFWVAFWSRVHPDPLAVRFGHYLRRKYNSDRVYIAMLTNRSLLVMDKPSIEHVLEHSPAIYADARLKRQGMAHFQPNAVTISRGAEWQERRRFNEAALESGHELHQYADRFLEIIRRTIASRPQRARGQLRWRDFEQLFEQITLQIIFGAGAAGDTALTQALHGMMRESNRVFALGPSRLFDGFYEKIRRYLQAAPDRSLAGLCSQIPSTERTRVENQLPHWMFAMNETLGTNTARALALIAAHPRVEARVRTEMAAADLASPQGINSLKYLTGCVQEAMRLWPTTPMLVRETVAPDTLAGTPIPAKTQVLILNSFNHRNRETHAFADSFSPEFWLDHPVDYFFNHLSNGTQVCAGKDLALFIATAVLATLLDEGRYVLRSPRLNPDLPLPYSFINFAIRLARRSSGSID